MMIYFETSAVNKITEILTQKDTLATKAYQEIKGNFFYISPVVLWEILLTNDIKKREELILYCQNLFQDELLSSPAELIINYIMDGCKVKETKYKTITEQKLGVTWNKISKNTNKSISVDQDELKGQVYYLRKISKLLHDVVNNHDLNLYNLTTTIQIKLNSIIENLDIIRNGNEIDKNNKLLYKIAVFLIIVFLCLEFELEPLPFKNFWDNIGINNIEKRIEYIFTNYEVLVHRGPFAEMALMAYLQTKYNISRGLIFDCLHSLYLPYVESFFTNDNHFRRIRDDYLKMPNFRKIRMMDELHFKYRD